MDEDDDLKSRAEALVQSAQLSDESDAEAEYRRRGRAFAGLSDGDLIGRLIEAIREHADPKIPDLLSEIDIRKLELPIYAQTEVIECANEAYRPGLVRENLKRYLDEIDKPQN